ncbi:MAG TPA: hypothetical protein VKX25_19510 [Bryobacteraceae bacterium]|nr:hypothetical protein [Bryobacteraceae bacterium]
MRAVLALPDHPDVRLLGGSVRRVTAQQALEMVLRGRYVLIGNRKRVRRMRPLEPETIWEPCYRTIEAPALQPSIEWCWSLRS